MAVRDGAPAIPPVPAGVPQEQRAWFQAMSDAVRLRIGQTANELDRSPTVREILDGDFGDITINAFGSGIGGGGGGGGTPPFNPWEDTSVPLAPTGLAGVAAGPFAILLSWNAPPAPNPASPPYIAFTEVFSHPTDDINSATFIGIGRSSFIHGVEPASTHFYWIRFRSHADIAGPFHPAINGVEVTSSADPSSVLTLLTGAITESELYAALTSRIDKIDVDTILGAAGLVGAVSVLDGVDTTQQTSIDTHTTDIATNAGDITASQANISALQTSVGIVQGAIIPPGISFGGYGDVIFTKNDLQGGGGNDGEIRVQGNKIYHPDGTNRILPQSDDSITTPYEVATASTDVDDFWLIWSDTLPDSRFTSNDFDDTCPVFPAEWTEANGWEAVDNNNVKEAFTPLETDLLLAKGHRDGVDSGISSLYSIIGANQLLPEDGADVTASASAFTALQTSVGTNGTNISANANSITLVEAAISSSGLATQLFNNPDMSQQDLVNDRPRGIKANYQSTDPSDISYAPGGKTILRSFNGSGDNTLGFGLPAFKVREFVTYRMDIKYRMVSGTINNPGMYVRALHKDAEIDVGDTHIGWTSGEAGVDASAGAPHNAGGGTCIIIAASDNTDGDAPGNNIGGSWENRSISALNTWYTATVEWTPDAQAEWASFTALNWSGLGDANLQFDYMRPYEYSDADNTANSVAFTTLDARVDVLDTGVFASATNMSQIESAVNDNTSAVQALATTTAGPSGAEAQYTIKVDANGKVAGFGLSSTSTGDLGDPGFSEFIVAVDRFAVVNTSGTGEIVPFVIDGGLVVIDGVLIKDATISSASIDSAGILTANIGNLQVTTAKIDDAAIQTGKIGDLQVTRAKINLLAVDTAQIADAAIETAKIKDLAVSTLKIEDDAVTVPVGVFSAGPVNCTYNSTFGAVVATMVIDPLQQPVFVHCFGHRARTGNDSDGYVGVKRNGTYVWGPTEINLKDQDKKQQVTANYYDSSPPAGNVTYEVTYAAGSGDTWSVTDITGFAIGMKK